MHSDRNALTEGPIWQKILLFAIPIFVSNVFQQFYHAFDSWPVGKFIGDTALAAASSSGSLIHMFVGFFNGVAMGVGKATVPMVTMTICRCFIRISYITIAVGFVNELTTVSFAYPLTWTLSSIIFLIYFLKTDWIHNFDRPEVKNAQ